MIAKNTNSPTEAELSSAADTVIDTVTATQQEAMQTMESARSAMMEGMSRVQREIADFVSERIRQDMETQQALLRCKTLDEVRDVQSGFFKTAMDQYAAEATKLMKLGTEIVARSFDRGGR